MGYTDSLNPVPQRTLSDEVAEQLGEAIRSGALPPGTHLVERKLAERLGVSRIPIREAMQQLADEGLVHKIPHRGTFVYAPSDQEIEEVASLRIILERFVMERVVANWTPEYEAQLRRIVDEMEQAVSQGAHHLAFKLDTQFHRTLWRIADHKILLEVVSGLRLRISRFLYEATVALTSSEVEEHVSGHGHLIDILKSGNVAAAKAEITQHIMMAKRRIRAESTSKGEDIPI